MKTNLFLFIFILLLTNSCKRDKLEKEISAPPASLPSAANGHDDFLNKIVAQLKYKSIQDKLDQKMKENKVDWSRYIYYGTLGDTLRHLLVPLHDASNEIKDYVRICIAGRDSITTVELVNIQQDFVSNKKVAEKAFVARDMVALSNKGMKLPSSFSIVNANKAIAAYSKSVKAQVKKMQNELASNITLNSNPRYCYLSFQIWYYINHNEPNPPTPSAINAHFVARLDYYMSNMTRYYWPLSTSGGMNHIKWESDIVDFNTLQNEITQIWNNETVWQFGGPFIINTYNEQYFDNGCDPENPGGGGPGNGEDPEEPECNTQSDIDLLADQAINATGPISGTVVVTDVGSPYMENGQQLRKRQFKWPFYQGSIISFFNFTFNAFMNGTQRFDPTTQDWFWKEYTFGNVSMEGSVPFTTTCTVNSTPQTTINSPYFSQASLAFPYTVTMQFNCGIYNTSRSKYGNANLSNLDVDGKAY